MLTAVGSDHDKLVQLARYIAHGIDQNDSGAAVGFSPSRVSQLLTQEDFQQLVTQQAQTLLRKYIDVNSAYDELEKKSLENLQAVLAYNRDPDLNLKIAMLANRAVRKGQTTATPGQLSAAGAEKKLVLNLSINLVKQAQNGELRSSDIVEVAPSHVDHAVPEIVNKLLGVHGVKYAPDVKAPQGTHSGTLRDFMSPIDV